MSAKNRTCLESDSFYLRQFSVNSWLDGVVFHGSQLKCDGWVKGIDPGFRAVALVRGSPEERWRTSWRKRQIKIWQTSKQGS